MRPTPNAFVEMYRVPVDGARTSAAGNNGVFLVPCGKVRLRVIASDGGGWDHVSVSLPDRCPSWEEMCHIKELFFRSGEVAYQLHVTPEVYVSNHQFCLHLWRPQSGSVPLPPSWMVGDVRLSREDVERMTPAERARVVRKLRPRGDGPLEGGGASLG